MRTDNRTRTLDEMTPELRSAVEAARAVWQTPQNRGDEASIREKVRDEVPPLAPDEELGDVIAMMKRERNRLGLSLQDVEARIGIDRSTLSRLETGKLANPTWATLKAYARGLGVSLRLVVEPAVLEPLSELP